LLISWMVFTLVLSALVALAVHLWEASRGGAGGALRWGWLAGAVAVPVLSLLPSVAASGSWGRLPRLPGLLDRWFGRAGPAGNAAPPDIGVGEATVLGVGGGEGPAWFELVPGWMAALSPWMAGLWALVSAALLAGFAVRYARLRRARSSWPRQVVAGRSVLVSDHVGPGVLGLVRGETVLPRWCLELEARDRALVVAHEEEHRERRDPLLLTVSRFVALLLPWNLPLWWMDRRLRVAVELDCDARVTARRPAARRRYAELLVSTAARPSSRGIVAPLALLVEPSTPLHRRIIMLTRSAPPSSRPRLLACGAGAAVVLGAALLLPGPDLRAMGMGGSPGSDLPGGQLEAPVLPGSSGEGAVVPPDPGTSRAMPADTPTFTPFTVAPEVRNRAEVARALEREYLPELRAAGIGGTIIVFFHVDDEGQVQRVRLSESSGHDGLDEAALRVAEIFQFSPAFNRDEAVPVWIQIPITFTTRTAAPPAQPLTADTTEAEGPRFTPFTAAPEIRNRAEVAQALQNEYPEALREAGIGGTVLLYFFIDAEGTVAEARLHESSGHAAMDEAALRVARVFQFSAAMNREERVPVWIQIPLTFTTR